MIGLNDRVYGLPVYSWLLIALVMVFFLITTFSSSGAKEAPKNSEPFEGKSDSKDAKDAKDAKVKVYNFNTSWCGWSVRFQPEWQKFEEEIKSKGDLGHVQAHDVKCDNPENDFLCKEYEVAGFPTVIIETNGKRGVYKGPRDSKNLVETIQDL
jgi:thiol-disulfide isomerase/thioredoxin